MRAICIELNDSPIYAKASGIRPCRTSKCNLNTLSLHKGISNNSAVLLHLCNS